MNVIEITELPQYKFLIDFKCPNARMAFKYTFVVTGEEFRVDWEFNPKSGKSEKKNTTELVTTPLSEFDDFLGSTQLTIARGHLAWLIHWVYVGPGFKDFNCIINLSGLERNRLGYDMVNKLPLLPQWKKIFEGHPRGEYYVNAQLEAFNVVSSYRSAAIELGTGLGKSEIILASVHSLHTYEEGNILVLVPNSAVGDEIRIRSTVDHIVHTGVSELFNDDGELSRRVSIINPVGYCNSWKLTDPDYIEWMSNVRHLIVDEAHLLSSDSYHHMCTEVCPNIIRGLAFSGTLDKFDAKYLHPNETPLTELAWENMLVTARTGAAMISRKVVLDTRVMTYRGTITDRRDYNMLPADSNYILKLDLMLFSPEFPAVVDRIYKHLASCIESPLLFFPVVSIESAHHVAKMMSNRGYRVCVWNSGEVHIDGDHYGYSLEDVKRANDERLYDILVTTTVALMGVDLTKVGGIISVLGSTSWATIAQSLGRAARGSELFIYLIEDEGNPMVSNQTKTRKSIILREYNVVENSRI